MLMAMTPKRMASLVVLKQKTKLIWAGCNLKSPPRSPPPWSRATPCKMHNHLLRSRSAATGTQTDPSRKISLKNLLRMHRQPNQPKTLKTAGRKLSTPATWTTLGIKPSRLAWMTTTFKKTRCLQWMPPQALDMLLLPRFPPNLAHSQRQGRHYLHHTAPLTPLRCLYNPQRRSSKRRPSQWSSSLSSPPLQYAPESLNAQ